MQIKAQIKFIRISPRKARLVADLVRHLPLDEAFLILKITKKRASLPLYKALKQSQANAVNNFNLSSDQLTIHRLEINEGPTYKRWRPVARGRAHGINKRTSHIQVVLQTKPSKKITKTPKTTKTAKKAKPKSKPKLSTKNSTKPIKNKSTVKK